jgi:hypothetical protein
VDGYPRDTAGGQGVQPGDHRRRRPVPRLLGLRSRDLPHQQAKRHRILFLTCNSGSGIPKATHALRNRRGPSPNFRRPVNKIVHGAGRSRGTFYKYFDDKLDLLLTLARECAENIRELSDRLGRVGTSGELRVWLADFLALHETHSGVFRVWLEQVVDDPAVRETSTVAIGSALAGITRLLSRVERAYPLDLGASALMVLGLL